MNFIHLTVMVDQQGKPVATIEDDDVAILFNSQNEEENQPKY
jgi:hypothetical protein